jgi:hypothetical protein
MKGAFMVDNNHRWMEPPDGQEPQGSNADELTRLHLRRDWLTRALSGWLVTVRLAAGQASACQAKLRQIDAELAQLEQSES